MRDRILDIVDKYDHALMDKDTRLLVMSEILDSVFGNIPTMTDVTTPEEVDSLMLSYSIEYPSGVIGVIKIDTTKREVQF